MKKENIFRNTKNWYLTKSNYVSHHLIKFAVNNAGSNILDVGCATGEYCQKLNDLGFKCVGVDVNSEYITKAKKNSVEAYIMNGKSLDFMDNSFDTVLLFEVLEHVKCTDIILKEAKRIAKKNVLITVPNCTDYFILRRFGLTYEHMLEKDHINFFTKKDLEDLLSKYFKKFKVEKKEPINTVFSPWWLRKPISLLYKLKFLKPAIYFRLYAVAEVDQ